jgi:hypothetical protein
MAKLEVLFGDFTFEEPVLSRPKLPLIIQGFNHYNPPFLEGRFTATINRVDAVMYVEESDLDEVCERELEKYESYLIPDLYKENGEIIGNTLFPKDYIRRY